MRATLLSAALITSVAASAQTTLFNEDFESSPDFTLNTTDAASVVGTWNTWVINNIYAGGDGDLVCFGFPFTYSIVTTPAQPVGITTPNGNYLHTASVEGIADGISNCSFGAADGLCISPDNIFSRMTNDVSTMGSSDVQFKFWWLCEGGSSYYGQVYYSTNAGVNWTATGAPAQYNFQGSWTEQTVTLPAFGNQATLRFGFRFVNAVGSGALDPGFGIDDVRIIASASVPNSITTNALSGAAFCQGASLSVPYTAAGTYTAGNTFSAELSDAVGSFAAPTVIGTLSSTVSGSITATIPGLTPVGTGYRIRVVSDQPVTVGTANMVDISITAAPFAGNDDAVTICKNTGIYDLADFIPGASPCGAWIAPGGAPFSGQFNSSTDNAGDYIYTTNCGGGCPEDASTITILLQDPANAGSDAMGDLCSNGAPPVLIGFVDGGDLTGIFWYNGSTIMPNWSSPGTYALQYVVYGTVPCVNDTAGITIMVNAAPNAGVDASFTICANDAPVDLFTVLGGTPQAGGTWTGPSGTGVSSILDPATSASGLYTYTVTGLAPCIDDQGFVAVVVDPCSGIGEQAANGSTMAWVGQDGDAQQLRISNVITGLDLVDAQGRIVRRFTGPFGNGIVRISMAGVQAGTYILRSDDGTALRLVHR